MDKSMSTRFVHHVLSFFSQSTNEEAPQLGHGAPDLPVLHDFLRAAGFSLKFWDKSELGGVSKGCRVIIVCQRSGTRVVMDSEGACTCPPEDGMKRVLDPHHQVGSRSVSPTPSVTGAFGLIAEDAGTSAASDTNSVVSAGESAVSPQPDPLPSVPLLSRQNTWSRDVAEKASAAEARRLSAPVPVQSAWASVTGDDLNVMAATDLLQEALSLLAGVKKEGGSQNIKNTFNGPSRVGPGRRVSGDPKPAQRLSRRSTGSSSLASSLSTSSLTSINSQQSDTTSTLRPKAQGLGLRRTGSLRASTASSTAKINARNAVTASKKGSEPIANGQAIEDKKLPSFLKTLSSEVKSTPRRYGWIPPKVKTNLTPATGSLSAK